jgi:hypothetical protein
VSAVLGGITTECDLIAQGRWNNRVRSALYDPATDNYVLDSQGDAPVTASEMRTMAQQPGQATTFTCVPPGSGQRLGLDRDQDGQWNFDEVLSSTKPDDPGSVPGACNDGIDNDGDGFIDLGDDGCAAASSSIENPECSDGYDNDGDGTIDAGDPNCTGPSSNRELVIAGGDDCHAGRTNPANGLLWAVLLIGALTLGTRRRFS